MTQDPAWPGGEFSVGIMHEGNRIALDG